MRDPLPVGVIQCPGDLVDTLQYQIGGQRFSSLGPMGKIATLNIGYNQVRPLRILGD